MNRFANWLWLPTLGQSLRVYDGATESPAWENIRQAIDLLDGDIHSMCVICERVPDPKGDAPFSGRALIVGGGANGQYLCEFHASEDSARMWVYDPTIRPDVIEIKFGDFMDVESVFGIDKRQVVAATEYFAEFGEMCPELKWAIRA